MRRSILAFAPIILLLPACTGGPETNVRKLTPDLAVAPEALDFGEVIVQYDGVQVLQLVNAGKADLKISDLSIGGEDDGVFSLLTDLSTLEPLPPDETLALELRFAPDNFKAYERTLLIESNDGDAPELEVVMSGKGVDGPIPDISACTSLDFGDVAPGLNATLSCEITNAGDGDLELGQIDQTGSGAFTLGFSPANTTVAPGDTTVAVVNYFPTHADGDNGELAIPTNDPDEGEARVVLLGNGGGNFDYPEAVIACPDAISPPKNVQLDGSQSSDPNGLEPLTYAWTLGGQPAGSQGTIDDQAAETTSLFADLAGIYDVELRVTNSAGIVSAPDTCQLLAIPEEEIHIELSWDTGSTDLDLHLIQSGANLFDEDQDCCWCNEDPSWGESGTADDPSLALDNQSGYGPENINLANPGDGDYLVKVHYFDNNGGGTTVATVRVYLNGVEFDTYTHTFEHQNRVWDVGYVSWPDGVFVTSSSPEWKPDSKSCSKNGAEPAD